MTSASLRRAPRLAASLGLVVALGVAGTASAYAVPPAHRDNGPKPTIVLVHGAFADASGWNDVITRLEALGYPTIAPANPLRGLPVDVPYVQSVLANIEGPVVMVGHSYGGEVITNAATGNPNLKGLVYVAAFAPAEGESSGALAAMFPGSKLTPDNLRLWPYPKTDPSEAGIEGYIKPEVFRDVFAADVPRRLATAMSATQRPADVASLQQPSGPPAWATIPSWFVVATNDAAIPPDTQRFEAKRANAIKTVELDSSHVAMISKPGAVEIERANQSGKSIGDVAAYQQTIIERLDKKPALVGHSFGGVLVQILAGRGLSAATVAIDPAPSRGVLPLPIAALKAAAPVLLNPANRHRAVALTFEQFRYGFANAVTEDEAKELYDKFHVAGSGIPLFQAAFANINPRSEDKADKKNADRGPTLIISGELDHQAPWAIANATHKKQAENEHAVTEIVEIANRGHSLTIDSGWREVAETSLAFIRRFVS